MSEDLPRANVKRLVKAKMLEVAASRFRDEKTSKDLPIHKDALLAFSQSTKIFIHYLSATANDICREARRQTINAEDVLKAVEEIEFAEFTEPLKSALEDFRKENQSKKAEKRGTRRKRTAHEDQNGVIDNNKEKIMLITTIWKWTPNHEIFAARINIPAFEDIMLSLQLISSGFSYQICNVGASLRGDTLVAAHKFHILIPYLQCGVS